MKCSNVVECALLVFVFVSQYPAIPTFGRFNSLLEPGKCEILPDPLNRDCMYKFDCSVGQLFHSRDLLFTYERCCNELPLCSLESFSCHCLHFMCDAIGLPFDPVNARGQLYITV